MHEVHVVGVDEQVAQGEVQPKYTYAPPSSEFWSRAPETTLIPSVATPQPSSPVPVKDLTSETEVDEVTV